MVSQKIKYILHIYGDEVSITTNKKLNIIELPSTINFFLLSVLTKTNHQIESNHFKYYEQAILIQ